jgi:hypothetical protein
MLSFQAAYAAPFIMMSQNRQQDIDRQAAESDYHINIKAELEIELLHQKIDQLRETEVLYLSEVVHQLADMLKRAEERATKRLNLPGEPDRGTSPIRRPYLHNRVTKFQPSHQDRKHCAFPSRFVRPPPLASSESGKPRGQCRSRVGTLSTTSSP